jgi:hypothetical protein
MAARVRVSEPDLRALLSVVSGDRGDHPAEGLPPSMLADLAGLIRCDILAFSGLDSSRKFTWFDQSGLPDLRLDRRTDSISGL